MVPQDKRPLSPHLQIYRWQLTSCLSILHRLTGIGLMVGSMAFTGWIGCLATGQGCYDTLYPILLHPIGQFFLLCLIFSTCYHAANGIRHLVWDVGFGFDLKTTYRSGWGVIIISVCLTVLIAGRHLIP